MKCNISLINHVKLIKHKQRKWKIQHSQYSYSNIALKEGF